MRRRRPGPARKKVKLALTMGDPAGIGPEVTAAAARNRKVRSAAELVAIGDRETLLALGLPRSVPVIDVPLRGKLRPGRPSADTGRVSFEAFARGVAMARRGAVDGVVTAPVSKEAWKAARVGFLDHTDYLSRQTRGRKTGMALVAGKLRTTLVTRHIPLSKVARSLDRDSFDVATGLTVKEFRKAFGKKTLRLGVCGLNPHAGEGGLLGSEEKSVLIPAMKRWRSRAGVGSIDLFPADDAWKRLRSGSLDALISLYHDQAMIPLKALAPEKIVNWTLGLGFVRTSPGHGTAFDIAGRGKADPSAMIEAALTASLRARSQG